MRTAKDPLKEGEEDDKKQQKYGNTVKTKSVAAAWAAA